MTEDRGARYPGYDVLRKRDGMSWDQVTREVIDKRMSIPRTARFFTEDEFRTLRAICARIVPQPALREDVPLAAYVDEKLLTGSLDGYRHADLPRQDVAWRRGLAGFNASARSAHGRPFAEISLDQQDALLRRAEAGELDGEGWDGMPSKTFFAQRVLPDIVSAYYAHPTAWSEIGYGGPASPRGYVRMELDRRDPWEAAEAKPGGEARARKENANVR